MGGFDRQGLVIESILETIAATIFEFLAELREALWVAFESAKECTAQSGEQG
jgi:hypothetical protein